MRFQGIINQALCAAVVLLTSACYILAFPPFGLGELAFIFLVPAIWWLSVGQSLRKALWVGLAIGWLSWFGLIIWLRHVTLAGTVALSGILGLFFLTWFLAAWWALPRLILQSTTIRICGIVALAGVWVVLEWVRTWFLSGFPWATLAASQWERPALLQMLPWTGAYGASFLLIVMNFAIGLYARQIVRKKPLGQAWYKKLCGEFYFGFGLLMVAILLFFRTLPGPDDSAPFFKAGLVQPYIPPDLKWDVRKAEENLRVITRLTEFASVSRPDVILWPEAATPWPVVGDENMREFSEEFTAELGIPSMIGSYALLDGRGYNGIFIIQPEKGVLEDWYAKRKLVPFGEFIPFRRFIPFVDTFVPIGIPFYHGQSEELLILSLGGGRNVRVAPLICYEDIFPHLARRMALQRPDVFFVATNNAWYGEEGGAYQHAAHSVLRAIENRRPVVRSGNAGWSGWIDEFGNIRQVALSEPDGGTVYYRGTRRIEIYRNLVWANQSTFYTRYGDVFVGICGLFGILGFFALRK